MDERKIFRGQIYYVYPRDCEIGSEQKSGRPAIVVSNDVGNEYSRVVEVVFLTTRDKKPLPTHVAINSARHPSIALCEQIDTVDKERIGNYINEVTQAELKEIERALLISLDIASNIKGSKALETWRKMMETWDEDQGVAYFGDNISIKEEEKEAGKEMEEVEKLMAAPVLQAVMQEEDFRFDVTSSPEYIRVAAQRDVYKELYMELLAK